jgi:histone H3/H4
MSNANVININKLMHENAKQYNGKLKTETFHVSSGAVKEFSTRIIDRIVDFTPGLCDIAKKHNRKTIMEEDVIEFFGHVGVDTIE